MRIKIALSAVALTAVVAAALPPAHAEGLTVPVKGGSRMCLTAPAAHRLTEAGIALRAGRPARLTGRDRTCVDLPVTRKPSLWTWPRAGPPWTDRSSSRADGRA